MDAISGENTPSHESSHGAHSGTDNEIVKVGGKNGFDVLRLACRHKCLTHEIYRHCAGYGQAAPDICLEGLSLDRILLDGLEEVQTQNRIELGQPCRWFTPVQSFEFRCLY